MDGGEVAMSIPEVLAPLELGFGEDPGWDAITDVIVIGLGAAGACAAIEATKNGAGVLVVDRLLGGGDTAISGGAVYFGGGTPAQVDAGFNDSVENMYSYLKLEVEDAVDEVTIRRFCEGSLDDFHWLEEQGVVFGRKFWPDKTPFPPNGYSLFYSGNEQVGPYDQSARPVPRAHKTVGTGMGVGAKLFRALERSTEAAGVVVRRQTRARRLIIDVDGRVVGVECKAFGRGPAAALHRRLARLALALPPFLSAGPVPWLVFGALNQLERRFQQQTQRLHARHAVVICTGGYQSNPQMLKKHAPYASKAMAIGLDANGSGILLGQTLGAATGYLENVGIFRTFVPPQAFGKGMLVDSKGDRFTNEYWYAGQVGADIRKLPDRRCFLILDDYLVSEARAELPKLSLFNSLPARLQLRRATKAGDIPELARKLGIAPEALWASIGQVVATAGGQPDKFCKAADSSHRLDKPPFWAIDLALDAKPVPATTFSLGGLVVDGQTGAVLSEAGRPIFGLYAAGRATVGLCSNSCVGGLSLADCVFSGRRAGVHAAKGIEVG
jgi:3-oxo-5alpha-steroid 4-dehydrogenase